MPSRARLCALAPLLLGFVLLAPATGGEKGDKKAEKESKVYRKVTSDKLEKIFKDLGVEFKKSQGAKDDVHFYDFMKQKYAVRLHNYGGQDLWIESIFADAVTLEKVNEWNVRAKFSRAVQVKAGGKANVSLESQLDCLGGVTDAIVRQFLTRFDNELAEFSKFLTK